MKNILAGFTRGFCLYFQEGDLIFQLCKFANFKFMSVEQLIFVVQKRLSYGKASIFDKKYDAIKTK